MILPSPFVKICSLREPAQAEYAVAAGADAIGLIFASARRKVSIDTATRIVRELRTLDPGMRIRAVGVFVDQHSDEINRVADAVGLDVVQLHGAERPEDAQAVERPVIKAVRLTAQDTPKSALYALGAFEQLARRPAIYLVDPHSAHAPGGTGQRVDWSVAAAIARSTRLVLAGGLTPVNVVDAVRIVRPMGVDVSSGVETDGAKDRAKVLRFVAEARAAFSASDLDERRVVPLTETAEPAHRP